MTTLCRRDARHQSSTTRDPVRRNHHGARHWAASILLLCGFVVLGMLGMVAIQFADRQRLQQDNNPWRRTARGWEHIDTWRVPPPPTPPHPLLIATWMLAAAVGSLYCCGPTSAEFRQKSLNAIQDSTSKAVKAAVSDACVRNTANDATNIRERDRSAKDRTEPLEVASDATHTANDAGLSGRHSRSG